MNYYRSGEMSKHQKQEVCLTIINIRHISERLILIEIKEGSRAQPYRPVFHEATPTVTKTETSSSASIRFSKCHIDERGHLTATEDYSGRKRKEEAIGRK